MTFDLHFYAPLGPCGYLPQETWRLEYLRAETLAAPEYARFLENGWRRFGHYLFRPRCPRCCACQPLRVVIPRFRPNRSQKRAWKGNRDLTLEIGAPAVTAEKLDLYDRYHRFQAVHKGWPRHAPKDGSSYIESFVENPFPSEEWCYLFEGRLVGVGYVDRVPGAMSAIYYFHDPDQRRRSLGTFHVLTAIDQARQAGLTHLYLGYYVAGSASMAYKARFQPCETLIWESGWETFAKGSD